MITHVGKDVKHLKPWQNLHGDLKYCDAVEYYLVVSQ
jgi:hypothetical protein